MKEVQKTVFIAFDGKEFVSKSEASQYEDANTDKRLVGLTIEQVREALSYRDKELASAIEYAGKLCQEARLAAGDLRRKPVKVIAPNGGEPAVDPASGGAGSGMQEEP